MKLTIIVSAILSLCRFGDHLLLMMLMFEASFSQNSCLLFCFVFFFFAGEINWNWTFSLYLIPFLRFSSAHIKIKSARIYWAEGQWGGVRARNCASVHSCAFKWSKTKGKTSVDIIFISRYQVSLMMELMASPCARIRVESRCWRQLRDALPVCGRDMFHNDLSTATESAAILSTAQDRWCTLQKQREVIFDLPRPLLPKVRDRTALNNSPPPGQKGCGCPGNSNTSNWTVHHWITF